MYRLNTELFSSPFQGSFASFPSWGLGTSKGSVWELAGNINRRLSPIRSFHDSSGGQAIINHKALCENESQDKIRD